ncbi:MAG: hypothetical protein ACKO0M_14600 [Cyanobium sp.]
MVVLHELTGPGLTSTLSGWWLDLDGSAALGLGSGTKEAWNAFRLAFPARVERLIPGLSCPVPEQPVDCCVLLALRLAQPIRLRCLPIPNPAAPHGPVRRALIRSPYHELAGEALTLAEAMLREIAQPGGSSRRHGEPWHHDFVRIQKRAQALTSHAFTNAVLAHAGQRGLPVTILHDQLVACPLLQIGTGSRSRLLTSSCLDSDSYIGGHACRNKAYLQHILSRLGYPVPRHIRLPRTATAARLMEAVRAVGYPCVLKPMDAELGAGVTIDIRDEAMPLKAAERAREVAKVGLLLEEQVPGDYHRLVVIEGQLVRVTRCRPPHLIGDGRRSIRSILAEPGSAESQEGAVLCQGQTPTLNDTTLHQLQAQGWTPDDVPAAGAYVVLRCDLMNREDWVCQPMLHRVDQSLHRLALGISKALGMANVGIDVLSPDISQPGGLRQLWVIEVNAIQRLHPGMAPLALQTIFPSSRSAHIPVAVIVCADEQTWPDAATLARLMQEHPGYGLALPARLGTRLDPEIRVDLERQRPVFLYRHPREVLLNGCLDAVLFLIDWRELSQSGLPAPWVNQLRLLGRPPNGMAKPWQRLLACVEPQSADGSSCQLPAWSTA